MTRFGVLAATLALLLAACGGGASSGGGGTIRVALGDIESVETLALFIAMERVRERGTDVALIELADEDLANQAVVGGQADVGLGAPYGLIEESGALLRIFCQLQMVRFFPVVDKAEYPDWQSLDGETFTVHSRGSTSEALARIIEQQEGIQFSKLSYVPSSEVRATALLRGNVKATMLDIPNKNYVMGQQPGGSRPSRSRSSCTYEGFSLIDRQTVRISSPHPPRAGDERQRRADVRQHRDLPPDLEQELVPYYEQGVADGLFTEDCGGERAAREDFPFYGAAGQLEADPSQLRVEDFWTLAPLEEALAAVEGSGN